MEDRFFSNPEVFNPDRWKDDFEKRLPRYAYFPFGGGPRQCIGQSFATMEALLLLATITQKFQIEPVGRRPVVPQPSITMRPRGGISAVLRERQQSN